MLKFIQNIISTFLFFIGKNSLPANTKLKAHIKLSALVTEISGKVGGSVFSKGKKGNQLKSKRSGGGSQPASMVYGGDFTDFVWSGCMAQDLDIRGFVMPDGSYQRTLRVRNIRKSTAQVSKAWQSLLDSDRAAWSQMAKNYPSKNPLGEIKTKSGYNFYMAVNTSLLSAGLSPLARPSCMWVSIIEDNETKHCFICGDEIYYCYYEVNEDDDFEHPADRFGIIQPRFDLGGEVGYVVITASRPQSKGRASVQNTKVIAVIKQVSTYQNFIVNLMLNRFFGSNIYDTNIQVNANLVNAGGAYTPLYGSFRSVSAPAVGKKIVWTLKADQFLWQNSEATLDFGSVPLGSPKTITVLVFGVTLPVNSAYSIVISGGIGSPWSIVYGDPSDSLDPSAQVTDKYGNILPIPLAITLTPSGEGVITATVTITCGSEVNIINLTGIQT